MKRLFVQASSFSVEIKSLKQGEIVLREIENAILSNPQSGDIVTGTGGVRKLRIADNRRGKGKRGGFRVLYLDLPHCEKTHLVFIYGKDELDDISADGKKVIRDLVKAIKEEAHE